MKKIHVVLFLFILTACIGQEPSRENWLKNSANEVIYVQVEGYEHRRNKKNSFLFSMVWRLILNILRYRQLKKHF